MARAAPWQPLGAAGSRAVGEDATAGIPSNLAVFSV